MGVYSACEQMEKTPEAGAMDHRSNRRVAAWLEIIDKELSAMDETVERFIRAVEPVLMPGAPPAEVRDEAARPTMCELSSRMRVIAERLRDTRMQLSNAADHVEL